MHNHATIVECIASGPINGTAMRGKNAFCLINAAHSVRVEYQHGYVDLAPGVSAPYNRVMEAVLHSTEDGRLHRVQAYIHDTRAICEVHAFRCKHEPQYRRGVEDRQAGRPRIYGCHMGMRSTLEADRAAYYAGWDAPLQA